MTPEDALERARAAAARQTGYREPPVSLDASPLTTVSDAELRAWALVEPGLGQVYSTGRAGPLATVAKRGLIRGLHQYLSDVFARQSRYNAATADRIVALEARVRELEAELARRG